MSRLVRLLLVAAVVVTSVVTVNVSVPTAVAAAADAYRPLPPTRILDTREGLGAPAGPLGEDTPIDITVTGTAGVPASGVGAVVLNITGTQPSAATFISAYPTGTTREGSNLNLTPGQTDSNLVIATVGTNGQISLYNRFGSTHLIADITGWFPGQPSGPHVPPPGPADDITGTLWVANAQPPVVSSCLFGVDAAAGTRTDDLYCIDLATVAAGGHDTGRYFGILQQRREFYALEERESGSTSQLVLTFRPLDNPGVPRAEVRSPFVVGVPEEYSITREYAPSPDGKYVMQVDVVYVYNDDRSEIIGVGGSVLLLDVEQDSYAEVTWAGGRDVGCDQHG